MLIADVLSDIETTRIEAYKAILGQFRERPDLSNLGLGPTNQSHSLDELVPLEWPKELDNSHYKYQQVEFLLDQAADLLDRCIRDRTQWEDLYEKWLRNGLEIKELLAISKIQDDEETAELFCIPYYLSSGEKVANDATSQQLQNAVNRLTTLLRVHLNKDAINKLVDDQGVLAMLNVCDPLSLRHDRFPIRTYRDEKQGTNLETKIKEFSDRVVGPHLEIEEIAYDAQLGQMQASLEAANARVKGLQKKEQYDLKDEAFKKSRRGVARQVAAAKLYATIIHSGALNFKSRMDPIQERYENDLKEAIAKMRAASDGLEKLYGNVCAPPVQRDVNGDLRFFDHCVIWVRKAITFLVQFRKFDQAFVTSFSLKGLLGERWPASRNDGALAFSLQESDFPPNWKQLHVRLRGFSAFVVGGTEKPVGTWRLTVTAPSTSIIRHENVPQPKPLIQSAAPCLAGRTRARDVCQQPDVLGTSEFFNLSPFGDWRVSLPASSLEGIPASSIEDIHLDLHLVARVMQQKEA